MRNSDLTNRVAQPEVKMASIGIVGGKQLRVALCVAKVQGVPAVPIVDVEELVAGHYDKVRCSNYSKEMVVAELEAMKAQGKCVAFLPIVKAGGTCLITGQSKAQGGYEAEVVGTGEAVRALHFEHAICRAFGSGNKVEEVRFCAAGARWRAARRPASSATWTSRIGAALEAQRALAAVASAPGALAQRLLA